MRNLFYIKFKRNRPQYQYSIYWIKLFFREYIENFNIKPIGADEKRPAYYRCMLECAKNFSKIF